ncbi:hypothetical protein PV783_13675 [Chitinophaga sp. CC14]|uniref:hypothetical protein n=1 Tax=Chitinophaga sp. CC14 TaxID=3029199 RepID=UPI003B7AA765
MHNSLQSYLKNNYSKYLDGKKEISKYINEQVLIARNTLIVKDIIEVLPLYKKDDNLIRERYAQHCVSLLNLFTQYKLLTKGIKDKVIYYSTGEEISVPDLAQTGKDATEIFKEISPRIKEKITGYVFAMKVGSQFVLMNLVLQLDLPYNNHPEIIPKISRSTKKYINSLVRRRFLKSVAVVNKRILLFERTSIESPKGPNK